MLIKKVKETIKKYGMLEVGDKVIVGVSGGADSIALLHLLYDLREDYDLTLIVAHLNHGFRGKEAEEEAEFVKALALKLNLPFAYQARDVPAYKRERKISSQEAARIIRYQFFYRLLKQHKANKIALGHNAEDQAETVLMWMIRGSGLRGLGGIPPLRENLIIRPLIETARGEIEKFLKENKFPFVSDSSNQKDFYFRNKIRHHLIPLLQKEYNPRLVFNLGQTSFILREEEQFLEGVVNEFLPKVVKSRKEDKVVFALPSLLALPKALQFRLLRKGLEIILGGLEGINYAHLSSLNRLLSGDGPHKYLNLPKGVKICKEYQELSLIRKPPNPSPFFYSFFQLPPSVKIKEINEEMNFQVLNPKEVISKGDFKKDLSCAYIDYERVKYPVVIRSFKEGDWFIPLGMEGKKKLKIFFIDNKIPFSQRRQIPLLILGDFIAWVGGLRIDQRARITKETKRVLKVRLISQE